MRPILILITGALLCWMSCRKDIVPDQPEPEAGEKYPGGENATTLDFSENAFGVPAKGLTAEEDGFFVTGNSFFRTNWVSAPGSVQSLDGLGPLINDISCGSCHFKDGRAQPPGGPGEPLRGLLFRLSIPGMDPHGGPLEEPVYGGQFQDKSIPAMPREGQVLVQYTEIPGQYPDGTAYSLRQPSYTFQNLNYGAFQNGLMYSPRIAQQLPGLGLLEIIPENDILEKADENDADQDGISGRPNYVWDADKQQTVLGRFGWKANQPGILQQTAGAFNGDIGITSSLFPVDGRTQPQLQQFPGIPEGGAPELADDILQKVTSYLRCLSVPARREFDHPDILRGKTLFGETGCRNCHRPQFTTGSGGSIAALRGQKIWPYTDLLLHDMGPELADYRPDFLAGGQEWRTAPLWGIGMIPVVNDHGFLLHDGRARNVEEAVLWHGGEAATARDRFKQLSADERRLLIRFVESL